MGRALKQINKTTDTKKMTPRKLKEYLKIAKSFGLSYLNIDGVEIGFNTKTVGMPISQLKQEDIPKHETPTEDELMYWSSGFDPREEREHAEKNFRASLKS